LPSQELAFARGNCRSNHVHVVLSSTARPKTIREQLKAWCTRRLKEQQLAMGVAEAELRIEWWAERGSIRWIHESDLAAAVDYVLIEQDNSRRFVR
jgi:hypothetical protein